MRKKITKATAILLGVALVTIRGPAVLAASNGDTFEIGSNLIGTWNDEDKSLTITGSGTETYDEEDVDLGDIADEIRSIKFENCEYLVEINTVFRQLNDSSFTVDLSDTDVERIDTNAFTDSALSGITLSDEVDFYGSYAFKGCENLESISIPKNPDFMGTMVFAGSGVSDVDLGDTEELGSYAFFNCLNLEEIDLKNVKKIGSYAFSSCENLTKVVGGSDSITFGTRVFYHEADEPTKLLTDIGSNTTALAEYDWSCDRRKLSDDDSDDGDGSQGGSGNDDSGNDDNTPPEDDNSGNGGNTPPDDGNPGSGTNPPGQGDNGNSSGGNGGDSGNSSGNDNNSSNSGNSDDDQSGSGSDDDSSSSSDDDSSDEGSRNDDNDSSDGGRENPVTQENPIIPEKPEPEIAVPVTPIPEVELIEETEVRDLDLEKSQETEDDDADESEETSSINSDSEGTTELGNQSKSFYSMDSNDSDSDGLNDNADEEETNLLDVIRDSSDYEEYSKSKDPISAIEKIKSRVTDAFRPIIEKIKDDPVKAVTATAGTAAVGTGSAWFIFLFLKKRRTFHGSLVDPEDAEYLGIKYRFYDEDEKNWADISNAEGSRQEMIENILSSKSQTIIPFGTKIHITVDGEEITIPANEKKLLEILLETEETATVVIERRGRSVELQL